jgi:hypothetical protein
MTSDLVPALMLDHTDRYVCLRDWRYAHEVAFPGCDCMRRKRPALPLRVVGGVLGVIGWFVYVGGLAVSGALKTADERLRGES